MSIKQINITTSIVFGILSTIACSKNKDASFVGASNSPRLVAPAGAQDSVAQAPIQAMPTQTVTPPPTVPTSAPLILPPPPEHVIGLTLLPAEIKTKPDSDILIGWILPASIENANSFTIRIFDNAKNLIFEKSGDARDFAMAGGFGHIWKTSSTDGVYETTITGIASDGKILDSISGNIIVRGTSPLLRLYLGLAEQPDNCISPTYSPGAVASSSLPFAFCTKEPETLDANNKEIYIGIAKFCFKQSTPEQASSLPPPDSDPCWTDKSSVPSSFLLQTGLNDIRAFVKDNVGNIGTEKAIVTLEQGDAPRLDIMEPLSSDLSAQKWKYSASLPTVKTLRWRATHNTTSYKDMRFIVTLVEAADYTKFKHLACSFKNDLVFKQCPSADIENSPAIKSVSTYPTYPSGINATGHGEGESEFSFTIPADWDSNKNYLLLVTGIDRAGNAAVASTQEINAGWEVVAGRTYNGLGGSGKNLNRASGLIRADKTGQIYDLRNNIKLNAIDNRSCRLSKKTDEAATPFDCTDILETNESILDKYWSYDSNNNLFYSITDDNKIVRINPKTKEVEVILGAGSMSLSREIPQSSPAKDYKINAFNNRGMFYDNNHKLLFFIADNMMFSLNGQNKISYVLGNGTEKIVASQLGIAQKNILLPTGELNFAVTQDNRIMLSTRDKPDEWGTKDGHGIQYLIQDFSLTDSNKITSIIKLTDEKTSVSPAQNPSALFSDIIYDASKQTMYASMSYWGIYKLVLPSKEAPREQYIWNKISTGIVGATTTIAPIPNTNLLYVCDANLGQVKAWNLELNTADLVMGFPVGSETDQLAQNRYLDTPRHLNVINDNKIIFSDHFNLQQIIKNTGKDWEIKTTMPNFNRSAFKVSGDYVLQVQSDGFSTYSISQAKLIDSKTNKVRGAQALQDGLSNDLNSPKSAVISTKRNAFIVAEGYFTLGEYSLSSGSILSNIFTSLVNLYTLNSTQCGASGTDKCEQAKPQTSGTAKFYNGLDFRLNQIDSSYSLRKPVGTLAFDASNRYIFNCANNKFYLYDSLDKKIYPFTAKTNEAIPETLTCTTENSHFSFFDNDIYFTENSKFYKITDNKILTGNSAIFAPILPQFPNFEGNYYSFFINNNYLYYADKNTNRILRNRR